MKQIDIFWEYARNKIRIDLGMGDPAEWTLAERKAFLKDFLKNLRKKASEDPVLAERIGMTLNKNGEFVEPRLSHDTIKRIFKERRNRTGRRSLDMFAIFLGFQSYEDFLLKRVEVSILENQPMNKRRLDIIGWFVSPKNRSRKVLLFLSIILVLFCGYLAFIDSKVIREFFLVKTESGLKIVTPQNGKNITIVPGPNLVGHAVDIDKGVFFWTNTNRNYRSLGKGKIDKYLAIDSLDYRFSTIPTYPCGIALDRQNQLMYLADFGSDGKNGRIMSIRYDGTILDTSIFDEVKMKPSSIIFYEEKKRLFWTDPLNSRISSYNLSTKELKTDFLTNVGAYVDGLSIDSNNHYLFWASNRDSLFGWVNLESDTLVPHLVKMLDPPTALDFDLETNNIYYTTYHQSYLRWFRFENDSIIECQDGRVGINLDAPSPGVVKFYKID